MSGKKKKDDSRNAAATGLQGRQPVMQRSEFLRRRRRKNLFVGLSLAAFCVIVFAWVVVQMGSW